MGIDYYFSGHSALLCWGDGTDDIETLEGEYLPWPDPAGNPVSSQRQPVTTIPHLEGYWRLRDGSAHETEFVQGWRNYVCTFLHELWQLQEYSRTHADRDHVHVVPYANHSNEDARAWTQTLKYTRAVLGETYRLIKQFAALEKETGPPDALSLIHN